jgi:hypothetical protein
MSFKSFLKKHNLEEISTGGSCTALQKDGEAGGRWVIVKSKSPDAPTTLNQSVWVHYKSDDDQVQVGVRLDKLINLKDMMMFG